MFMKVLIDDSHVQMRVAIGYRKLRMKAEQISRRFLVTKEGYFNVLDLQVCLQQLYFN